MPGQRVIGNGTREEQQDHKSRYFRDRLPIFYRLVELIGIEFSTDGCGGWNGGTDHAHKVSLFFLQLGVLTRKDFLFEQEIRAGKMVIDAADKQSSSARKHMDHFPAFQAMFFERGNAKSLAERVVPQ